VCVLCAMLESKVPHPSASGGGSVVFLAAAARFVVDGLGSVEGRFGRRFTTPSTWQTHTTLTFLLSPSACVRSSAPSRRLPSA